MKANMLSVKLEKQIFVYKELVENALKCIKALQKFDGKVVNIKVKNALKDKVISDIYITDNGWIYENGIKYSGYELNHNNRWFTDGTINNGGCQNGGYIDNNDLTIPLIKDENNRLNFSETERMINLSISRKNEEIEKLVKALQDIDKEREHAKKIEALINEYKSMYHYSIQSLNISVDNVL